MAEEKSTTKSQHLRLEEMMMRHSRTIVFLTACCVVFALMGHAQNATLTPTQQLIKDVVFNELQDRECDSFWAYRIQQKIGHDSFVKHQVETEHGPIFRILQTDGKPLSGQEQSKEEQRLNALLNDPRALQKNREEHLQDEERLQRLIRLMPQAFLFDPDGQSSGDLITFHFRPNPDFKPPTYEARVFHGMAGTIEVNQRLKRFVAMQGTVVNRVDFGYGLLGYVDKGGKFAIHREQVSQTRWKTNLVDVHVSGHVILFKSVSKDHHEERSEFQPVPTTISLSDAKRLLDQSASQNEAVLHTGSNF